MTPEDLRKLSSAQGRYITAARRAEEARKERNRLLAEALEDGWSQTQVADATGLTRGRVGQLAQENT